MPGGQGFGFKDVHGFVEGLIGGQEHAKRVLSLSGATPGVMRSASLGGAATGHGLALAHGSLPRHAIKQVARLLSNPGIEVDALLAHWVSFVVGSRREIAVAMDWADFEADCQATLMLSLPTRHGRATPLVWLTVDKARLKEHRNAYEYWAVTRLADLLRSEVKVLSWPTGALATRSCAVC